MYKLFFIIFLIVVLSVSLIGCTSDDVEPNVVWSGVLIDAGVSDKGGSWVKYNDSNLGVTTKLWSGSYPVLYNLVPGEFYSFHSYVVIGGSRVVVPLRIIYISNIDGEVVWSG